MLTSHRYIGLVGGDASKVTVWGQSAGGSAIMHLLTAFGGTQDPLFQKALVMSPAVTINVDRAGQQEQSFEKFSALAGCTDNKKLACLRTLPTETLRLANAKLNLPAVDSQFLMTPAADGKMVRQHPVLELKSGELLLLLDGALY